ncbi:hypothetical protein [Rhizomonospora bruguierae]|uniref:hypothetical protein n=1 Tax=Rhizomonospora bruguierae TaxID=1581705 RepID=UPI001BD075BD|nr:hypothetical protein [Micromonospora sp. NBRC 107566]
MYLSILTLVRADAARAQELTAPTIARLLWEAAGKTDEIEHISARPGALSIDVGFFHVTSSPSLAATCALAIVQRAIGPGTAFDGWSLSSDPVRTQVVPEPHETTDAEPAPPDWRDPHPAPHRNDPPSP